MKFARGKNATIRADEVVPCGKVFEIADLEIERFTNLGYEILDENPEAPDSGGNNMPPEGSSLGKQGITMGIPREKRVPNPEIREKSIL